MNQTQHKLFGQLESLVATNEAFFSKVIQLEHLYYKVFNYRLASYSDFLLPGARQSRGIMFEVDRTGTNMYRLACSMPQKFFNYNENPLSMNLDISNDNIDCIMIKMDGSIISTFMHGKEMRLKSKTSMDSEHAMMATAYLNAPENAELKTELTKLTELNFSVHMELTSPSLRIVLGYPDIKLTILAITDNTNPDIWYRSLNDPKSDLISPILRKHWVDRWEPTGFMPDGTTDTKTYIESIKDQVGIEGIVVRYKNGETTKHKTDWYCALHHTKDSVSAPRRLFECVINEATDDLKAMFADDELTIQRIADMENLVRPKYNHIIETVESFYNDNKHLDRKDYAVLGRTIEDGLFGLKMNLYVGRANNYKEFAIKHNELFNINTTEGVPENE